MLRSILLRAALLSLACAASEHPILIVVSYDAFKYDFFELNVTPNMERLRQSGTHSEYMINIFPTKTFPNHHSIATGVYADVHGVVGNNFYNAETGKIVKMSQELYSYNDKVVPIWRWNEDQGKGRHSGSMMWPGGNFLYQGKNITHIQDYISGYDWWKRVDTVISWLTDPDKPANLVMFYIEEPDTHLHGLGPDSEIVIDIIRQLDNVTQYLEDQLEAHGLRNRTNIINLSDHGIVGVKPPNFINVKKYMRDDTYVWSESSPVVQITPKEGYEEEIYNALQNAASELGHFKVLKKEEYPDRWHYKDNPRSPPLLIVADEGYGFDDLTENAPLYAKLYNFTLTDESQFGVHGYDYNLTSMHPYFMARGPRIKQGHKVAPFPTVDLIYLFTEILGIPPLSGNGTYASVRDVLVSNDNSFTRT